LITDKIWGETFSTTSVYLNRQTLKVASLPEEFGKGVEEFASRIDEYNDVIQQINSVHGIF